MQPVHVDSSLSASLREKNVIAFDTFYNQYAPAFYGYVRQLLNQHKAADDTLAHAFVSIWNTIETYDSSKERLFTWSLKIVRKEACEKKVNLVLTELFSCQQAPAKNTG